VGLWPAFDGTRFHAMGSIRHDTGANRGYQVVFPWTRATQKAAPAKPFFPGLRANRWKGSTQGTPQDFGFAHRWCELSRQGETVGSGEFLQPGAAILGRREMGAC
jgi:hypothetical protein